MSLILPYDSVLRMFNQSKKRSFCIDGTACVGKSTIVEKFNNFKLNRVFDATTCNYDSVSSLHYLLGYLNLYNSSENTIFDRSPVSNLAFLLIQHAYAKRELLSTLTPSGLFNLIVQTSELIPTLEFIKAQKLNVIMLINSDIEFVRSKMEARNNGRDLELSRNNLYIHLQNEAYSYLAKVLDYPCLDLSEFDYRENLIKDLTKIFNRKIKLTKREPKTAKHFKTKISKVDAKKILSTKMKVVKLHKR